MTDLAAALAEIHREHQKEKLLPYCTGCDRLITDHAEHVAALQVAYLRENLHGHAEELAATKEWAVLNPAGAVLTVPGNSLTNAQKMAALVPSPLVSRLVTDWSRNDHP